MTQPEDISMQELSTSKTVSPGRGTHPEGGLGESPSESTVIDQGTKSIADHQLEKGSSEAGGVDVLQSDEKDFSPSRSGDSDSKSTENVEESVDGQKEVLESKDEVEKEKMSEKGPGVGVKKAVGDVKKVLKSGIFGCGFLLLLMSLHMTESVHADHLSPV